MEQPIIYKAIGYVETDFDEPATPEAVRSSESRIILDPAFAKGLTGMEADQRVLVVFHFHRSQGFDLLQHPRGDRSRPPRGVFTLRSPRRPNSIGVTVVDLAGLDSPCTGS